MHIMELRVLYRILHLLKVPALVNRRLGSTAKRQGGENNQLSLSHTKTSYLAVKRKKTFIFEAQCGCP